MGLGGGTAIFLRPIINCPNWNEAGIPTLTLQLKSHHFLCVPFWLVFAKYRAQWPPLLRNVTELYAFKFWTTNFQKLGGAYCLSEGWYLWNPDIKWVPKKIKSMCDKCVSGDGPTWGLMRVKPMTYLQRRSIDLSKATCLSVILSCARLRIQWRQHFRPFQWKEIPHSPIRNA